MSSFGILKILKLLAAVACLLLFLHLSNDIWIKFNNQATTQGTSIVSSVPDLKSLPCITLCAEAIYRNVTYVDNDSAFIKNTFNLNELIQPDFPIFEEFNSKEISTSNRGRCYTMSRKVLPNNNRFFQIILSQKIPSVIYIHNPGDEFWLVGSWFPVDVIQLNLNSLLQDIYFSATITLKTMRTVSLNKKMFPCDDSIDVRNNRLSMEKFLNCSRKKIFEKLSNGINCTILSFENIGPFKAQPCQNSNAYKFEVSRLSDSFKELTSNVSGFGCFLPCSIRSFDYKIELSHKNAWPDVDSGRVGLLVNFDPKIVTEVTETYFYDVESLLAATGGNLGLLLGSCCLQILWTAIDVLQFCGEKLLNKKK